MRIIAGIVLVFLASVVATPIAVAAGGCSGMCRPDIAALTHGSLVSRGHHRISRHPVSRPVQESKARHAENEFFNAEALRSQRAAEMAMMIATAQASLFRGAGHDRVGPTRHIHKSHASGARRRPSLPPSPVALHVIAGWYGNYRDTAWTPIRVALHNRGSGVAGGTIEIPDAGNQGNNGEPPQPFHTRYDMPVLLPPHATKHVVIYVPGADIQGEVDVSFHLTGFRPATASTYPSSFNDGDLTIGTLAGDPAMSAWVNRVNPLSISVDTVGITPATLDPVPQALASFDVIVLTNTDTGALTHDQLSALAAYVRAGGCLVLVGGPDWQETLRPLPPELLPGSLAGSRTVPNLRGLQQIDAHAKPPAHQAATVSVLGHVHGDIVSSENGVPLVVRMPMGTGQVEYLGFDPAGIATSRWSGRDDTLTRLVTGAAAAGVNRAALSTNSNGQPPFFAGGYGPVSMASELANVPAAALPSLVLFIALTIFYVFLLGPVNFVVLRRLRRLELSWVTVPVLAALCVGSTFLVAYSTKGHTVLLNTIGVVQLDGSGDPPATFYTGLFAPLRGDYDLTYHGSALAASVPQPFFYYGPGQGQAANPLGLSLQEGALTRVTFVNMNMWSMRDVALHTRLSIHGGLQSNLHVTRSGDIVGTIHNTSSLDLVHVALIAGRASIDLPNLNAGGTVRARIRPNTDIHQHNDSPLWTKVYGRPNQFSCCGSYFGGPGAFIPNGPGPRFGGGCCPGPTPPAEKNLSERIRDAAAMLPEAQSASSLGEVMLAGWTQQPLGSMTVDGATPQRRDLMLVVSPLSIHFPAGPFHLRTGTIPANLVDESPQAPQGCCYQTLQAVALSWGGSATFEFDMPRTTDGRPARFSRLTLSVDAGGAYGADIGHVLDPATRQWVRINLASGDAHIRDPERFVSSTGTLLVRIDSTASSGNVLIADPHEDLQVSGMAVGS